MSAIKVGLGQMACRPLDRDGERLYNAAAVIGPGGELVGVYRKLHLFAGDVYENLLGYQPGTAHQRQEVTS